jgi:hypothetical protein
MKAQSLDLNQVQTLVQDRNLDQVQTHRRNLPQRAMNHLAVVQVVKNPQEVVNLKNLRENNKRYQRPLKNWNNQTMLKAKKNSSEMNSLSKIWPNREFKRF